MSYQALYRKYRPGDFTEVKGQEHIVTTLSNQIRADRIGHAYLFCGTRGTGKTTVAKIFAKAVNCENPGPAGPCGECDMCRAIEKQISMNVVEIDAASNNRVDDVRQVIEEVQYSPSEGRFRVYIIDEVHMLSNSAFNALLKTLEEPPSYLIFILATTEAHKIPPTILSRCQRYDFKRIRVETIADRLKELLDRENIQAEERALTYIARQADGALRDGLSLLERCVSYYFGQELTYEKVLKVLGAVDQSVYHKLMERLLENRVDGVMESVSDIVEQGRDLTQFVNEFVWYLRNLLVVKTADEVGQLVDMSAENIQELQRYAGDVETDMLFRYIRVMSGLANDMRYGTGKRVMLEVALIKLCRPQMEQDYESLVNRLHNLEQTYEKLQTAVVSGSISPAVPSEDSDESGRNFNPEREIRPEAIPEDVRALVQNWHQVISRVSPVTRKMLEEVRLSVSDSGDLVLAFSQSTTARYFNSEVNKRELTEAAEQLIGKRVELDIRHIDDSYAMDTLPELRNIIKNVTIEIID